MEELNKQEVDQLLKTAPGGIVKLAFDEMLTILYYSEAFYSLIKNAADKEAHKSSLALMRIVYSTDIIYLTQQIAMQKHRKDNMIHFNFRTLQQDGIFKWVMISGNKTEETYTSGPKTVPVYSCVAMDITTFMLDYKKMEQANEYRNKIAELSKDLYFEYEIATDTLSFSELFREIFGKDSVMPGFRGRLEKTKTVHQEELPAVISIYNSMMGGRKLARFELRLITKDGVTNWYLCYASMIFDENKNPYKVVGKLATTNHTPAAVKEKKRYTPQLDALTKVCTKESAEFMIMEALKNQEADALSALLVIDIRNYKGINEIRKSIRGENVLFDICELIKKNFRTSDIVGRLGLCEFVIYMKEVSNEGLVYETAEKLCKLMEDTYSYSHTQHGIAVSIGIALHKGAQEYQMLMTNANTALVIAKKVPLSSFEVFSGTV
jgi:diguanylate cyclase (GGDEF)-like protein